MTDNVIHTQPGYTVEIICDAPAPPPSNTITHGQSFDILGSGFKTKSGNTPSLWDFGQAPLGTLLPEWGEANAPDSFSTVASGTQPGSGSVVNGPHQHSKAFLGGQVNSGGGSAAAFGYQLPTFPYWSDGKVSVTCNAGKHPPGTVHVHVRDEVNGHQYKGTRELT